MRACRDPGSSPSTESLAAVPNLARLVPSHGAIVEREPAALLRRLSANI
jgi:hypothetical protein